MIEQSRSLDRPHFERAPIRLLSGVLESSPDSLDASQVQRSTTTSDQLSQRRGDVVVSLERNYELADAKGGTVSLIVAPLEHKNLHKLHGHEGGVGIMDWISSAS